MQYNECLTCSRILGLDIVKKTRITNLLVENLINIMTGNWWIITKFAKTI